MNFLVTGATGNIGPPLIKRLIQERHQVSVLVRQKGRLEAKFDKKIRDKLITLEVDLSEPDILLDDSQFSVKPDVIIHLAAVTDINLRRKVMQVINVDSTLALIQWACCQRVKRFIFASSIEAVGPVKEDAVPVPIDYPCNPISTYGKSKLLAEKLLKQFANKPNKHCIEIAILRLGMVYGPGSYSLIPSIAGVLGMPEHNIFKYLPVYGHHYIHPIYIDDVVEAFLLAAMKSYKQKVLLANIVGPEYLRVRTLIEKISEAYKKPVSQIYYNSLRREYLRLLLHLRCKYCTLRGRNDLLNHLSSGMDGRKHRAYSLKSAQDGLDFYPRIDLQTGIKNTLEWAEKDANNKFFR